MLQHNDTLIGHTPKQTETYKIYIPQLDWSLLFRHQPIELPLPGSPIKGHKLFFTHIK